MAKRAGGRWFRCRDCGAETDDKIQHWLHIRVHMRPDKMLICHQCPFVTLYKHHLEYHLRNHSGHKPFKCDKCLYRCVNKSMLKSHMKSHSSVRQFKCANCKYNSRYLHSLKMHLRKYGHQPVGGQEELLSLLVTPKKREKQKEEIKLESLTSKQQQVASITTSSRQSDIINNNNSIKQEQLPPISENPQSTLRLIDNLVHEQHQCILDLRVNSKLTDSGH